MLTPSKVAKVLDTGLYAPKEIYDVDECSLDLSTTRRMRQVAPRGASVNAQASLSSSYHSTVVDAISTFNMPIPPFILDQGKYFMEDLVSQSAQPNPTTEGGRHRVGFSNTGMTIRWWKEVFDLPTRD